MKFNNEATIYSIHVLKLICVIVILLVLTCILTTKLDEIIYSATGLNQTWTLIILVALYLFVLLYFRLRQTSYFSYNDEGSKVVIRSYLIGANSSKRLSFEIPKNIIYKYTIDKTWITEKITIYIRIGSKISNYPPISIASITSAQKEKLLNSLNEYIETNPENER